MKHPSSYSHTIGLGSFLAAALLWLAPNSLVFADQRSDVEALEAQCEQEREARIKPLRDME